jgi:hypothetical protein|nr:MAG TPA: hypothetical protein [Bacteriophage sp.]
MSKENVLYIFMNKNFEFTDEQGNITEDIFEASGYKDLERARKEREEFDEPEEWKIVKKRIIVALEEIVDE